MTESSRVRGYRSVVMGLLMTWSLVPWTLSAQQVGGSQLRILDSTGLVRATRVVRESGDVKVSIEGGATEKGECVATNLDGLAAERTVLVSPNGECVFSKLGAGSWQLRIPGGARWRAQIHE
jgi:hypothetical protein